MPTSITPAKSHSKVVLFSSGEGIVPHDFMLMQDLLTHRAWDLPHYPDVATQVHNLGEYAGASDLESNVQAQAIKNGAWGPGKTVYSFPGCVSPRISGDDTGITGGGFAVYGGAGGAPKIADTTPDPAAASARFRFGWAPESDDASPVTFTHSAAHATLDRVDIVTVKIEDVDNMASDLVTRQAKSATTGAISSSGFHKRRTSRVTFTMTEGTPGDGFPAAMPSADDRLLYSVRRYSVTNGGALGDLCDWTVPFGRRRVEFTAPMNGYRLDTGLASSNFDTGAASLLSGGIVVVHPTAFGNPHARILGLRVHYQLPVGSNVLLVRFRAGRSSGQWTLVETLSSKFTMDGTSRVRNLFFGNPFVSDAHTFNDPLDSPPRYPRPYWMQGQTFRRFSWDTTEYGAGNSGSPGLALLVSAGGAGVFYGAQWTFVE